MQYIYIIAIDRRGIPIELAKIRVRIGGEEQAGKLAAGILCTLMLHDEEHTGHRITDGG